MTNKSVLRFSSFLWTLLAMTAMGGASSQTISSAHCGSDLQQIILGQVFVGYNKDVRPPPGDNATLVTANAMIRNIVWVNEKNHQWKVDLFFRQAWNDPRLQYNNLLKGCPKFQYVSLITQEAVDRLWKPNLFFTTELEGTVHSVIQPNVLIRISPNGDILYSIHVEVTLFCSGTGSKPGEYMCPMALYPYGPTTDEIVLRWEAQDPIQIDRSQIFLDDHIVGNIDTLTTQTGAQTGLYSTLVANFHFLRKACLR